MLAGKDAPERRCRAVLGAPNLLEHDEALALELLRIEGGVPGSVGEDIEGGVEVPRGEDDVIVREVVRGRGVHLATEARDRLVDHARAARGRPFEQEVLDEVGQAGLVRALVAGPHAHPEMCGGGVRRAVILDDDRRAALQGDPREARHASHAVGRRRSTFRASFRPARKWTWRW